MNSFNVLVTDNDQEDANRLATLVNNMGFATKIVYNGKDALWEVASDNVGVVLMDGKMPEVSGLAAARAINNLKPDLPVVMVTGHPEIIEEIQRRTPKLELITKPIFDEDKAKLEKLIRDYAQQRLDSRPREAELLSKMNTDLIARGSVIAFYFLLMSIVSLAVDSGVGLVLLYIAILVQALHYYAHWQIYGASSIRPKYLVMVILGSIVLAASAAIAIVVKMGEG